MTTRLLAAVFAAVLLLAVNLGLIVLEQTVDPESGRNRIAPTEVKARAVKAKDDPLDDLRFISANREANFKRMGLQDELLQRTLDRTRRLEDAHMRRLERLFSDLAEDTEGLTQAFCGRTTDNRPRYTALRYLVEQKQGLRGTIDLENTEVLERQDWSLTDQTQAVYTALELGDERKDDATLMGVAAILVQQERAAREGLPPWGSGALSTWSWDRVVKEHRGVDRTVVSYFALMHLAVEVAHSEGGLCRR